MADRLLLENGLDKLKFETLAGLLLLESDSEEGSSGLPEWRPDSSGFAHHRGKKHDPQDILALMLVRKTLATAAQLGAFRDDEGRLDYKKAILEIPSHG